MTSESVGIPNMAAAEDGDYQFDAFDDGSWSTLCVKRVFIKLLRRDGG